MVRPVIEYAATIMWSPHAYCDTYKVEIVQFWAARSIMTSYTRIAIVTDMSYM